MTMSADLETLQARLGDALTPEALLRQAAGRLHGGLTTVGVLGDMMQSAR